MKREWDGREVWSLRAIGTIHVASLVRWNRKLHGVETIPHMTHCWEHPTYVGIAYGNAEAGQQIKVLDAMR